MNQFAGGFGNPVSLGLYRFEGTGQDRDQAVPWSVILKLIQSPANVGWVDMGEGEDQTHWNYWKRETLVYQSDLLETLPEGMVAPRCFGWVELPGNIAGLWLEDVVDSYGGVWTSRSLRPDRASPGPAQWFLWFITSLAGFSLARRQSNPAMDRLNHRMANLPVGPSSSGRALSHA